MYTIVEIPLYSIQGDEKNVLFLLERFCVSVCKSDATLIFCVDKAMLFFS